MGNRLFREVLKSCINHNSTEAFPFINILVKYTPVTGCPAFYDVSGRLLKKFYIVCFTNCVLG